MDHACRDTHPTRGGAGWARMAALVLLVLFSAVTHAQVTRYVTDSLKLESRSGPGVKNRIMKMLSSGTPVKVLEQRNGWSRIDVEGDGDAWILSRYLMDEASARNQVSEAKALRDSVEERVKSSREQLTMAENTAASLEVERSQLAERAALLADELDELKRTASSAVDIKNENERLRRTTGENDRALQDLRHDYLLIKQSRERDWFIAGAGVLFGGIVLGLIIPKLRFRRRRGWNEL
ncbi:MAG: SH3 domain protein [Gammaproteobacteria bacterium]|jgi:SH3 domain protein